MISPLYDSASREYKKARRQHWKSTKNRPVDVDVGWSPFRATEKKYKARFPPPDLSAVLDLASLLNANPPTLHQPTQISEKGSDVFIIPDVPGARGGCKHSVALTCPTSRTRSPARICLSARSTSPRQMVTSRPRASSQTKRTSTHTTYSHHKASGMPTSNLALQMPNRRSYERELHPIVNLFPRSLSSGPRRLIANDPASVDNFSSLQSLPKLLPEPSVTLSDCLPSDLVSKLRWANIGWSYHWGSKQYDFSRGKGDIDSFLRDLCKRAVGTVPWEEVFDGDDLDRWGDDDWRTWKDTYGSYRNRSLRSRLTHLSEPDAGIVNFYQTKDTLMAHVDRSEVCATSPLVSISLGNAAVFLIGGLTRDTEPIPIILRSGDVLIMSGPACRRAYHGVPRILETTLPDHFSQPLDGDSDWESYKDYMCNSRININVRQVFPKGFDPHAQDATR
ncbi:hypothetical protein J3R82DRAFT_6069 [Butyriboletus roseoflavus]|nr:hypothetical protein J3R82DRAFT_6069 [Butyriboletus roseoflavus]